jgi:hypothetical protein
MKFLSLLVAALLVSALGRPATTASSLPTLPALHKASTGTGSTGTTGTGRFDQLVTARSQSSQSQSQIDTIDTVIASAADDAAAEKEVAMKAAVNATILTMLSAFAFGMGTWYVKGKQVSR